MESGTARNLAPSEIKLLSEKLRYIFLPFLCVRGAVDKSFFFNLEFFSYQCAFPRSHSGLVDRLVRSLVPPSPFLSDEQQLPVQ